MKRHTFHLFSNSLFLSLRPTNLRMRQVIASFVLVLTIMRLAANAQQPTATRPVKIVSNCEGLANKRNWLNPADKAAWIQVCKNGQVERSNLEISHETWPGSVLASVNIASVGPLVDLSTIMVTFVIGPNTFTTLGTGTGIRMADVYFEPCTQPVVIKAVAKWKSIPVGVHPRSVEMSNQISISYQSSHAREFHPHVLTEPCLKLSLHTALLV